MGKIFNNSSNTEYSFEYNFLGLPTEWQSNGSINGTICAPHLEHWASRTINIRTYGYCHLKRLYTENIMKTSKQTSQMRHTWIRFWTIFALLFIVFAIADYLVAPMNLGINTTYPLKIVCFLISYGGPFLVYFLVALSLTAIIGRIAKSPWRGNIAAVFNKALWPALILALLMLYGLWYGRTH